MATHICSHFSPFTLLPPLLPLSLTSPFSLYLSHHPILPSLPPYPVNSSIHQPLKIIHRSGLEYPLAAPPGRRGVTLSEHSTATLLLPSWLVTWRGRVPQQHRRGWRVQGEPGEPGGPCCQGLQVKACERGVEGNWCPEHSWRPLGHAPLDAFTYRVTPPVLIIVRQPVSHIQSVI